LCSQRLVGSHSIVSIRLCGSPRRLADLDISVVALSVDNEATSGAIGRLVPQDVAGLAGYLREHTQAS